MRGDDPPQERVGVQLDSPMSGESIHATHTVFTLSLNEREGLDIAARLTLGGHPLRSLYTQEVGDRLRVEMMLRDTHVLEPGVHALIIPPHGQSQSQTHYFRQEEQLHIAGIRFDDDASPDVTRARVYFSRAVGTSQVTRVCMNEVCEGTDQNLSHPEYFELRLPGSAPVTFSLEVVTPQGADDPLVVPAWQLESPFYTGIETSSEVTGSVIVEAGRPHAPCEAPWTCWGIVPLYP